MATYNTNSTPVVPEGAVFFNGLLIVDGFTFRIAEEGEILPQHEVFNTRYDRERKLKNMPIGYLPMCRTLPNCQADLSTLVAVKTEKAADILIAASGGHTSANLMYFYMAGCAKATPTLAAHVHRLNKMKEIFPYFSKLTDYRPGESTANNQTKKKAPKQEKPPVTAPSAPVKTEVPVPATTAKNEPETTAATPPAKQDEGPNMDLLIELITKARGGRSVQKFSHECGVPYTTLYTALVGKRRAGLPEKYVRSIATHAAPNCGVTLEMLAAANGTIVKSRTTKPAAGNALQDAPAKKPPVESTPVAAPAAPVAEVVDAPMVAPAPAPIVDTVPAKPFCYNVFEVVQRDSLDGIQRKEEYVCSFVEEKDARQFATENSCERPYRQLPRLTRGVYIVRPGFLISSADYEKGINPLSLTVETTLPKISNPSERGYEICITNKYSENARLPLIPGAAFIQGLDERRFPTDWDAAKKAEVDGIAIIHDMPGVEDWTYIDTPENRVLISNALPKYPRCDVRGLRQRRRNA